MDKFLRPGSNFERLAKDWQKYGSLVVAYDFDDTVYDYWKTGEGHEMIIQLLRDLKSIGCKLVCWTAAKDLTFVIEYLTENDIPFNAINEGGIPLAWESPKPFFSALLDDRAGLRSMYDDLTLLVKYVKEKI